MKIVGFPSGYSENIFRQTINAMEANKYVPSTVLSLKIARVFGKPLEEIFFLDEND
ncbi:MAG: transcriptional regulator [Dysgonamonadaceae bacterium]|nr:transcriptional regulator [Dysgonamonadaceae bacterium]